MPHWPRNELQWWQRASTLRKQCTLGQPCSLFQIPSWLLSGLSDSHTLSNAHPLSSSSESLSLSANYCEHFRTQCGALSVGTAWGDSQWPSRVHSDCISVDMPGSGGPQRMMSILGSAEAQTALCWLSGWISRWSEKSSWNSLGIASSYKLHHPVQRV